MMCKKNSSLDLNKVREIIFQDIFKLLDSFSLEYSVDGDNIFMKCPVHEGSDNPFGLSISLDKKMWRCWTRGCQEHYKSDIFGFVKGVLDTDSFSVALKHICEVYNVNEASKSGTSHSDYIKPSHLTAFGDLVRTCSVKPSVEEAGKGSTSPRTIQPRTNDAPSAYFISRGFKERTLEFFGVRDVPASTKGFLRHRAIIPIHDAMGHYVAYIGRAMRPYIQPKYVFSKGIRKSDFLYNFHRVRSVSQTGSKSLFIVEGQGDVWKLWENGVTNAVGLFGKEVSESQKRILMTSGFTNLIILTDNDQAGREAKIKIKREFKRYFNLVFPEIKNNDIGSLLDSQVQTLLKDLKGHIE
jgi:5S rRNA maturation endonuclease (ribonuclease M5)